MRTILQLNTSIFAGNGQSTRLATELVATMRARHPGTEVVVRDLAAEPVPHLTEERFAAFGAENPTPEQKAFVAYSDTLIDELRRAELIVLGLPMYNFGIPSQLKAWIDHVARAGVTFRYGEGGPVGLLKDKKLVVFATRGGRYAGTSADTQTQYVRDIFAFLGIRDVDFIYVEGLARGDEARSDAVAYARTVIDELVRAPRIAA